MLAARDPFQQFLKRLNLTTVGADGGAQSIWPKESPVQVLAGATLAGVLVFGAALAVTGTNANTTTAAEAPPAPMIDAIPGIQPRLPSPATEPPTVENAIPDATGQTLSGYRVTPFFPRAPLTVTEPTRLRSLPSLAGASVGGTVQPGARLRVNGKVDGPDGPWLQTRLPSGGVGFLQEDVTADLGRWRAQRAAERAAKKEEEEPANPEALEDPNAPVLPTPPPEPTGDLGPT